ncbi:hypothetical protein [Polyangium jinanense]|uniref:Uncharacterized protein n=1 Tax=Polyangium jinanense TaxID=2829994 RepID=A0A9X3XFL7_9BACT|nr:hypothetical protein [Polyangium jinanense]MDC3960294.1 hypothetical protein [Polyangium jinanense]MDC3988495.1 hypothetical protein [Polyangium jinanense]
MRYLSLAALKVALADLFSERHAALVLSGAGKTYESILLAKKQQIDALPGALTGGKPLAESMAEADDVHDGFGSAIWHMTEAYERCPKVPAHVRAAVGRVRAAFIPQLDDLQATYVQEVHAAIEHRKKIDDLKADLQLIPIAEGLTLLDWAEGYVGAAEQIGALLSQRADADTGTRRDAGRIRTSTLAVLGRFRGALGDEIAVNAALPRDLDARVFGLFDQLAQMRADAIASKAAPAPKGSEAGTD